MTLKYKLTGETKKIVGDVTLHRIKACQDIPRHNIKAGDLGGWIQHEGNLSFEGDCWVADEAMVFGLLTLVSEHAIITDHAMVGRECKVRGDTIVADNAVLQSSELTGSKIAITDDSNLTRVNCAGTNITIGEKAVLENVVFSAQSRNVAIKGEAVVKQDWRPMWIEGNGITILGNSVVQDIESINGHMVMLNGDCTVKYGVNLSGSGIILTDACSLEGKITVGDNVTLQECVSLYNDTDETVMIHELDIHGDMHERADEIQSIKKY